MKHTKILAGLVGFGLCAMLTACGSSESATIPYALITSGGAVEDSQNMTAAYQAVTRFAQEQGEGYASYVPVSGEQGAIEAAFDQAVAAGAKRIVVEGSSAMNICLYEMQRDYRNVRFLILDGSPCNEQGEVEFRGNTVSLSVDTAEVGYLAGYEAVLAGYTSLGYLCEADAQEADSYGAGYIQGAEAACEDLGKDGITVQYRKLSAGEVQPTLKDELVSWYQNGMQIVFTDGGEYENVLSAAAAQSSGCIIGNGECEIGNNVIMYVDKNYDELVYHELGVMAAARFDGGHKVEGGAQYQALKTDWNSTLVTGISQESVDTILNKMSASDFTVSASEGLDPQNLAHVTVTEYGA